MPVETAKCWWLLKIEPNTWAGGKGSCAVCVDLQAVGALEFFGELCSLAKGFGPIFEGVWAGFREREGSIFSNHQHFAVSTGMYAELHALSPLRGSISPWYTVRYSTMIPVPVSTLYPLKYRCPSELCPPFICPPGRYSPVNSVPLDNIHW